MFGQIWLGLNLAGSGRLAVPLLLSFSVSVRSIVKPKPPGGANGCRPGWSGVAAELAELALVNQVDDGTKELKS